MLACVAEVVRPGKVVVGVRQNVTGLPQFLAGLIEHIATLVPEVELGDGGAPVDSKEGIRGIELIGTEAGLVGSGGVHILVAHQLRNDRNVHTFPL